MAIVYPLALPSENHFRSVQMRGESTTALTRSIFTASSQVQEHQGQMWRIEVSLRPMKREVAEQWIAWALALAGRSGTFLMYDPAAPSPRGSLGGTPLVNGAGQSGKVLVTDGWTPSTSGLLLAGDYIQLGSGEQTRLYKVMQDVASDGGGNASIDIWPRLREAPADNEALITTKAKGAFRMTSDTTQWNVNVAQFYGFGFSAEEAY